VTLNDERVNSAVTPQAALEMPINSRRAVAMAVAEKDKHDKKLRS